jgi:hypothetical protein
MISVEATLENWSAWAPGYETQQQWMQWQGDIRQIDDSGSPDMGFLPAMFRRRLSRLSKLALTAAFNCIEPQTSISTVFASRHGELDTSVKLLEDLAGNTPLSPTKFSTSVHNTASGMFSIANKDRKPSTAIAAGIDTLEMGFIEASCQLANHKHSRVMLVLTEEPIHHHYRAFSDMLEKPFSLALLLSNSNTGVKLSLNSEKANEPPVQQHGLSLISLLAQQQLHLQTQGNRFAWNWSLQRA